MAEVIQLGPSRLQTEEKISRRLRASRWINRAIFAAALAAGANLGMDGFPPLIENETETAQQQEFNWVEIFASAQIISWTVAAKIFDSYRSERTCQKHVGAYAAGKAGMSGRMATEDLDIEALSGSKTDPAAFDKHGENLNESEVAMPTVSAVGTMFIINGYSIRDYEGGDGIAMMVAGSAMLCGAAYGAYKTRPSVEDRLAVYQRRMDNIDNSLAG